MRGFQTRNKLANTQNLVRLRVGGSMLRPLMLSGTNPSTTRVMSQIQTRQFSSYYRILTGSGQEKLLEYQRKFDQDPNNVESAFLYFRVYHMIT